MRQLTGVVAINISESGLVLSGTRRGSFDDWGFIGGKIDEGETADQAVMREYKEETGLDLCVVPQPVIDMEDGSYYIRTYLITNSADQAIAFHKFRQGHQMVEDDILVGYVPYTNLLTGTFAEFNAKLLNVLISKMNKLASINTGITFGDI